MFNFSIMISDKDHITEYCNDIADQIKSGVATMPLFCFTLNPEGDPVIDKAELCSGVYKKYKEKLDKMGLPSGVLIQASIGHGWKINQPHSFQKYVGLKDGLSPEICCPLDKGFQKYIRNAAKTIAKTAPDHIMLDDDFRLMGYRPQHGCACPLHLAKMSEKIGKNVTREALYETLNNKNSPDYLKFRTAFIQTQISSLIECAKEIRSGINEVDPTIPGSFCLCGEGAEGGYEIASIMAGKGNPIIVRVNNAHYCAENPRDFIRRMHDAATQLTALNGKPDVVLAETDTCPQNRYSTPAAKLHSHFTFSLLEGMNGAKHWITRLAAFEPNSGKAYRKTLSKHNKFYNEISRITPELTWLGCKIPIPPRPNYVLTDTETSIANSNGWCSHVLDRFGIPTHFSNNGEGICFFDGAIDQFFTDDEILTYLKNKSVFDAQAAKRIAERGFSKHLGVEIKERENNAPNATGEIYYPSGTSKAMYNVHELIPLNNNVKIHSNVYHLRDGKFKDVLFPGVTSFNNELGGVAVVYSGVTTFPFDLTTAFGFLNETRKAQLVKILTELDSLPVYYPDDAEVFMKAAKTKDGKLFCAILNLSLDQLECFPLVTEKSIKEILRLNANGEYEKVDFSTENGRTELSLNVYPYDPVILIIDMK